MYICKRCGNKEDFYEDGSVDYSSSADQRMYVDENGEMTEYGDVGETEEGDYGEWNSDGDGVMCNECDCPAEEVSEEEWEAWEDGKTEEEQKPKCNKIEKLKARLVDNA